MTGRTLARARFLAALLLAAGCSSGGDGGTQPGETPAITIAINPTSASVVQGGSTQVTGTITRSGGYTGDVALTVEGLVAGIGGTVGNVSTSNGVTTGTVTITVASDVATGVHNLTVRAAGAGVAAKTATFALTVTAANAPSYTLAATPATLSLAQGASGTTEIAITRTNFTGEVALTAEGLPAGVTAAFDPASTEDDASTLTLNVGAGVAPGQSTITVRGTADDVDDRTATLTLTVTVAGGYTLSATPATLSIAQGAQGQSTIDVDRTGGFAGAVALAVTGAPAGLTATLNPTSTTANTSTLTVAAGASLATGTYTLTITGTTPGLADQTTTVAVTVTSSGGGGSSISLDFSACTDKPIWFAFQDGAGAWTQVAGSGDVYQFAVASGNAGIAWVSNTGGGGTSVIVQYYTTAELGGGSFDFCGAPLGGKTVNGTVTGLGAADFANVFMGGGNALVTFLGTSFQLQHVASGPQDLVAFRTSATGASASDRGLVRRDQDVANGGSVGTLDLNGAESFAAATAQLTAGGAAAGAELTFLLNYHTGAACHGGLLSSTLADTPTSATLSGIPADQQRATDFHRAMVLSTEGSSARTVFESFHTLADRTVNLGAALGAPDVTSLGGPYKRLQADLTVPNEYNAGVSLGYSESGGARAVQIGVTDARLGGGSASIVMPDFTGVSGWNSAWAPPAASPVDWAVGATGTNVAGSFCQEGARFTLATVTGTK